MTAIAGIEAFLLIVLMILVAGLLRSHAEILRVLNLKGDGPQYGDSDDPEGRMAPGLPRPPSDQAKSRRAPEIGGVSLYGEPLQVSPASGGRSSLLAFLSSGCLTCEGFWKAFQPERRPEIPGGARLVIITKDPEWESPSKLRELASPDLPVVMSSSAWAEYDVPTSPYFVFVDGSNGLIMGDGAASAWEQVVSLLRDAVADVAISNGRKRRKGSNSQKAREARAERELAQAGIRPGDPTLYGGQGDSR